MGRRVPDRLRGSSAAMPGVIVPHGQIPLRGESMTTVEPVLDVGWVDEVLLAGPDDEVCLRLGAPVTRAALRRLVAERQARLESAGLRRGGAVALRLPPSLAYIANLLAAWRI